MSKRYKAKRRRRYYVQRLRCQRCGAPGFDCRLSIWDKEPEEILCGEHAHQAGYCRGCGIFWAGVTSFDMRRSGLCDHCQADADADFYEPEPEEDYDISELYN